MNNENELEKNQEELLKKEKEELATVVAEINRIELEKKEKIEKNSEQGIEINQEENKLQKKEKNNLVKLFIIILILITVLLIYRVYLEKLNEVQPQLTIDEQIIKTLNKRYGETFTKINDNLYKNSKNNNIQIITNANSSNKLIIYDDYLNNLQTNKIINKIKNILKNNGINNANVELSPKKDCRFVGTCIDNEYFFEYYQDNTDITKLSERSANIDLKKYIDMSNVDFFNSFEFILYIKIKGDYSNYDVDTIKEAINNLFRELNEAGYKNTLGYEINVKDKNGILDVLKLKSKSSTDGRFDLITAKES